MEWTTTKIWATAACFGAGAGLFLAFNTYQNQTAPTPPNKLIMQSSEHNIESGALQTMLIAGGCFWCVEADLEKLAGVQSAVSGYAGGTTMNPTYENYVAGGHREVVEVTFDPARVTYEEITVYALKHMDPTDGEGSFFDRGSSYAPAVYFETPEQKQLLESLIAEIDEFGPFETSLAVLLLPRPAFWPAETYHQDYYKGTLSGLKYQYYRSGSGRDAFIKKYWGDDTGPSLPWRTVAASTTDITSIQVDGSRPFADFKKPADAVLKATLDPLVYKVTQQNGTERAGTSPLDKNYERGIYIDVLSGEPLFSSRDKYDSGTGWPSFVTPITPGAITEHEDRTLFSVRTEVRSAIADNHLGHVFSDGPQDRGGLRYCMNGVALQFVAESDMEDRGYGEWLNRL